MHNYIAVTIGDIKGIGIHILIDIWKKNKVKNFILFSNHLIIDKFLKNHKYKIKINNVDFSKKDLNFKKNYLNIHSYKVKSNEDNTYKSLEKAYNKCKNGHCIGIITLPLRKDLIIKKINKKFIGQTEFFQRKDNKKFSNMILYHRDIIVSPITTHIPINKISKKLSNQNFLFTQIVNLQNTLKRDFKIDKPKIIITGINPHAGENGKIGTEEKKIIIPTIKKLQKNGINIFGPFSADSVLIKKNIKKYDCFVFMYHDQALIPFKYISQFSGVNYTGNLNIIRLSPDHGTAYNLVNSKEVSNLSLINCFKLIKIISKNRI